MSAKGTVSTNCPCEPWKEKSFASWHLRYYWFWPRTRGRRTGEVWFSAAEVK